jgi:hypothetical protein
VSFTDEERADLIAALSKTAEMLGLLLDATDVLLAAYGAGRQPHAGDIERLREHSVPCRQQLDRLKQHLASINRKPPSRPQ